MATNVTVDVSRVVSLLGDTLDLVPHVARSRGHVLPVRKSVTASTQLVEHTLNESALRDAGTDEDGVDGDEDPAALLEEKSRAEETEPESNFEPSDQGHAGIVVLLDEAANALTKTTLLRACGGILGVLDHGEEDTAGVGSDVEDAVDSKRQDGEGDLLGEEPNKGHGCRMWLDRVYRLYKLFVLLTEILHVLVSRQLERAALTLTTLCTSTVSLEHDYAIGNCCGHKGSAVGESSPAAVEVEGKVAEGVAESAQEESDMAAEPGELESLFELSVSC